MRSEEGAGGPGAALSARGPIWREKLSTPEAQFRRESPRRESALAPAPSFSESGAGKPREEKRTALSKVGVGPHNPPVRRLGLRTADQGWWWGNVSHSREKTPLSPGRWVRGVAVVTLAAASPGAGGGRGVAVAPPLRARVREQR